MLRKCVCAFAILGLTLSVALAEEVRGRIVKIADKKVTVMVGKKGEEPQAKEFVLGETVKVFKMDKENKVDVSAGLKADEFKNIDEKKGVRVLLNVTDGKITEIILRGERKKKDAN